MLTLRDEEVITTCREVCVSNVILEGDLAVIMKALQSDEVSLAPYGSLTEDVKVNSRLFSQLRYSRTRREGNKVTHILAKYVFYSLDFAV